MRQGLGPPAVIPASVGSMSMSPTIIGGFVSLLQKCVRIGQPLTRVSCLKIR